MEFDCAERKLIQHLRLIFITLLAATFIAACSNPYTVKDSAPKKPTRVDRAEKVIPKVEPKSKYGNPKSYVVFGQRYYTLPTSKGYLEQGIASWYGTKFHGRRTSSGETYDMYAMTAAHKTLPLPTYARVTNKKNGRSIIVRINDRGPFHENRIIDLSYAAATKLGIVTMGTGLVEVRAIDPRTSRISQEHSEQIQIKKTLSLPKDVVDVSLPATSVEIIEPETNRGNATQEANVNEETTVEDLAGNVDVESEVEIFVQVGAFRSQENAYKLRNQYRAYQLGKIDVYTQAHEGSPIYKAWIGPLNTVEQADDTVAKLKELGHTEYKLVFEQKQQ